MSAHDNASRVANFCNRIIEYSFYALFLLVPLIFSHLNFELFEFNKMLLTYALSATIVGAFLIRSVSERQIRIVRTPLDIPLLLFFAALCISTVYSTDIHTSLYGYYSRFNGGLVSIGCYILLYFVFVSTFVQRIHMVRRFLFTSLFSGLLVIAWGLPSHFGYDPSCLLFQGTFDTSCWTEAFKPEIRIFSTLGQPNWLAAYLAILVPIALALGLNFLQPQTKKYEFRILNYGINKNVVLGSCFLILASLFYVALLFTKSRSGFAGLGIGLLFFLGIYFWLNKDAFKKFVLKKFIRAHWHVLVVLVSLGLITFVVGTPFEQLNKFTLEGIRSRLSPSSLIINPSSLPQGPALETGGTESGKIRSIVWKGAIDIARNYPLFGSGVETFAYAYYRFKPVEHNLTSEWDYLYNKAHNEYLNYLATTGFVGFGTYLLLIGTFLFVSILRIDNRKLKVGIDVGKWRIEKINPQSSSLKGLPSTVYRQSSMLVLALLAAYFSILVSNFFGFSVVITNLYLFLIPAFIFVLNGVADSKNSIVFPQQAISDKRKVTSFSQWITTAGLLLVTCYLLLTVARFWFADTYYASGYNMDQTGQYATAYEPLFNSVRLRPDEPTFRDELAYNNASLATLFGDDATTSATLVQNAITLTDDVVHHHPNIVTFWKTRARIFYTLSAVDATYFQEAIASLEKARDLAPTDAKILYNLAVLYGQNEEFDKAIAILEGTVKIKPDYQDAYYALGLFYNEKGEVEKGIEQMQFILDNIASDDADARDRLTEWQGL